MAVLAGAEVIHSTVTGIGERAGNAAMEETALALLTMYGIDVGLDYSKFNEMSKLVREISGTEIPESRPFIGDGAYTIESGIVTGWYRQAFEKDPTTVFPVRPEFVGHEMPQIVMGKKSGIDSIAVWSQKLGIELTEEEALAALTKVKLKSHDLKRVLTEDEFREIAENVKAGK